MTFHKGIYLQYRKRDDGKRTLDPSTVYYTTEVYRKRGTRWSQSAPICFAEGRSLSKRGRIKEYYFSASAEELAIPEEFL